VVLDDATAMLNADTAAIGCIKHITSTFRALGTGLIMVTEHLPGASREEGTPARALVEGHAGIVVTAGLHPNEVPAVEQLVQLTPDERKMLADWADSQRTGRFLIKVSHGQGGRIPGIPFQLDLTSPGPVQWN